MVEQLTRAPGDILKVAEHRDYGLAVPTPDHFIPLLYVAALAAEREGTAAPWLRGYAMGSISMTCYGAGMATAPAAETTGAAALPAGVPADQTNM